MQIRIRDPGLVNPGSGILLTLDQKSGMENVGFRLNIPDPQHCEYESGISLSLDQRSGMEKVGSRINIPDLQHCEYESRSGRHRHRSNGSGTLDNTKHCR
jgi:hypothetical protein